MKRAKKIHSGAAPGRRLTSLLIIGAWISSADCTAVPETGQIPPGAQIKEPVVAGQFYPADSAELRREIDSYLQQAQPELTAHERLVALLAPHAGTVYSGPVAAYAYQVLRKLQPETIVLVGPSHRVVFPGISVYDRGYFRTPLGLIPVDTVLASEIAGQSANIRFLPEAFAQEHNIEVQLPFIQRVCPDARIVPLIMGSQTMEDVNVLRHALGKALSGHRAALIGSTDLSHYHPATKAIQLDEVCMNDVHTLDGERLLEHLQSGKTEMCGGGPAAAVILAARDLGADVGRILKYGDSGDVEQGDKSQVVGYLAAALIDTGSYVAKEEPALKDKGDVMELTREQKTRLLTVARESIEYFLLNGSPKKWSNDDAVLADPRGAFVTLKKYGELRGCIGQVEAVTPLLETVASCAVSSAVRDPRFLPVDITELPDLHIEISVLTKPAPVEDLESIVVGQDGLIINKGPYKGLLLPQVPVEQGWDREEFLRYLCRKAGLGPEEYKTGATILRFQALVFGENESW